MFDKYMMDLVFGKERVLPKPTFYMRMGRFYFTKEQTRETVTEFKQKGLLGIKVANKQLFFVKRK
jgi:hypothetical protein